MSNEWKQLTDAEKRVKVAECCPEWTDCYIDPDGVPAGKLNGELAMIPYYTDDLNVMHEIEKILNCNQCANYNEYLQWRKYRGMKAGSYMWHFPASLRAEAFVKIMEKT